MTLFDTILLIIVLAALVVGARKGLIKQTASLMSWVIGIIASLFFGDVITDLFIHLNPEAASWPMAPITTKAVALSIFFLVVTLGLRLLSMLLRGLVKATGMGCLDRAGGAALFVFKYTFILSIIMNLLFAWKPDAETFRTRHALNNKPFEITLDLMPRILGFDAVPSDSLPQLTVANTTQCNNEQQQ